MRDARADLSNSSWRKSSYSNGQGGDCLEVAVGVHGFAPVRDTKRPDGPTLEFTAAAWSAFVDDVKGTR
ncbi:DUF397 domain-containing protein [Streptomyces bathyalis]|uniref:DUF397 domain-containing protein n=1 Tax=Streptomyces bathyalis TaxID=2710756 RepID=A0A7T1TBH2_9ACTN|nr:DUF397 domain-containing protein [Streptomyces bathyalis]QPP09892.1 DUF397 domain-containing protein [Streptomyces bathyalis]